MNSIIPGTIEEPGLDTHEVGTLEAPSGGAVNMHTIKGQKMAVPPRFVIFSATSFALASLLE